MKLKEKDWLRNIFEHNWMFLIFLAKWKSLVIVYKYYLKDLRMSDVGAFAHAYFMTIEPHPF